MATFRKFEDIEVWKLGRQLVKVVYKMTAGCVGQADHGLRDQIQRAAVSIPSNIAEGYSRRGNREFLNFLWIAKGSAAEVQSQLYHFTDLKLASRIECKGIYDLANEISVKLYRLMQTLSSSPDHTKAL